MVVESSLFYPLGSTFNNIIPNLLLNFMKPKPPTIKELAEEFIKEDLKKNYFLSLISVVELKRFARWADKRLKDKKLKK
jgi:hypothetical protein